MTDVFERYYVDLEFGEEYRGVYLIRGENVVMVGQLVRLVCCLSLGKGRCNLESYLTNFSSNQYNQYNQQFHPSFFRVG